MNKIMHELGSLIKVLQDERKANESQCLHNDGLVDMQRLHQAGIVHVKGPAGLKLYSMRRCKQLACQTKNCRINSCNSTFNKLCIRSNGWDRDSSSQKRKIVSVKRLSFPRKGEDAQMPPCCARYCRGVMTAGVKRAESNITIRNSGNVKFVTTHCDMR